MIFIHTGNHEAANRMFRLTLAVSRKATRAQREKKVYMGHHDSKPASLMLDNVSQDAINNITAMGGIVEEESKPKMEQSFADLSAGEHMFRRESIQLTCCMTNDETHLPHHAGGQTRLHCIRHKYVHDS